MKTVIGRFVVVLGVLIISAGIGFADLMNGDFTGGSTLGWNLLDSGQATYSVISSYGGSSDVLMLTAESTDDENFSSMTASAFALDDGSGNYVPVGTNALEFDAEGFFSQSGETWPTIDVSVNYINLGGGFDSATLTIDLANASWASRSLALPSLDTTELVTVMVRVIADYEPPVEETWTVNGYFDNFAFVPEPASCGLMIAAVAALVSRRRRSS